MVAWRDHRCGTWDALGSKLFNEIMGFSIGWEAGRPEGRPHVAPTEHAATSALGQPSLAPVTIGKRAGVFIENGRAAVSLRVAALPDYPRAGARNAWTI